MNKTNKIKSFLDQNMSGVVEEFDAVLDQVRTMIPSADELPSEIWVDFKKLFDPEELVRRMIPLYDDSFTEDEIDELSTFFSSKIGIKYLDQNVKMSIEASKIGQVYSQEIVEIILMKIDNNDYDI